MRKNKCCIFLSSCYDKAMQVNRELFRSELLARFNILSGAVGINTYLIDFEFGIPYGTSEGEVIRICTSEVKRADYFLCILGNRYGHPVAINSLNSEMIETIKMLHPSVLRKEVISILEIEILTAIRYIPKQCVFFLQNDAEQCEELASLISEVILPRLRVFRFTSERTLADMAVEQFEQLLSSFTFSTSAGIIPNDYRLFSRKLRYYVPDEVQDSITNYVTGNDRRIFILSGLSGCGKTTALSKWLVDHSEDGYIIKTWFHNLGPDDYVKVVTYMTDAGLRTSNENSYVKDYALRATFEKEYPEKHIFVLDGVNHLCSIDNIEPWITMLSSTVKVIISTDALNPELTNHPDVLVLDMEPVDSSAVIHQVMLLEGKQYEYDHLCNVLYANFKHCTLSTIIIALQQFLRQVKYTSYNAPSFFEQIWNDKEIERYLSSLNSPESVFSTQYQYVCNLVSSIRIDQVCRRAVPLLMYSERGLSSYEIAQLVPNGEYIIYFFYFLLDNNEDLFLFPKQFKLSLKNGTTVSERETRRQLLAYFQNRSDSRGILEEFYQLVHLRQKENVIHFLSSFRNFRMICPDSSAYSEKMHSLVTSEEWRHISKKWYREFKNDSSLYTVNNMLSVCDCLWEVNQLYEAYRIICLVIERTEGEYDADFLRQYHFQAANVCDELSNSNAVDHIDKSMMYMDQCKVDMIPLDIIDTYLMAVNVYANALELSPEIMEEKGYDEQTVFRLIELCEHETDTHLKYFSTLARTNYHNIAEAYITLGNPEAAKYNILKAMDTSYQSEKEQAQSLYLYSQICFMLHKTYDPDFSKAESAIRQCCSIHQTRYRKTQTDDVKQDLAYSFNQWALVLNENGRPQEAVEKLRVALSYEQAILKPKSIYRTYCNAGLFCLYSFRQSGNKLYLSEGKTYALRALQTAKKCTRSDSAESVVDTFDILILLAKLSLAEKKRIQCQFYLFRAACCLDKSAYRDVLIDVEYNFEFTKKWEVLLLKLTNIFLHSYENIRLSRIPEERGNMNL